MKFICWIKGIKHITEASGSEKSGSLLYILRHEISRRKRREKGKKKIIREISLKSLTNREMHAIITTKGERFLDFCVIQKKNLPIFRWR